MASNYVDSTGDEGRFHSPHSSSTTPTGAAAPRTMRRSFSSASSSSGGSAKCVCAPATHANSFKCRLHRTNSQSHGHAHGAASPPAGAPRQGVASSTSSRTVEAQ
jgi:hypothetical protein